MTNAEEPDHVAGTISDASELHHRDSAILDIPADPELWAIARLVASSIAARMNFELDALDDLRLSIDELCTLCAAEAARDDRIQLTMTWGPDDVEVTCHVRRAEASRRSAAVEPELSTADLSRRILAALVEEFEITVLEDGARRGWFRVVRSPARQQ